MKKPSSKIREEIAKLHEQLKVAETREAERIGRVALRAGLGDVEIEESDLQAAFEDLAKRFRGGKGGSNGRDGGECRARTGSTNPNGEASGGSGEA